MPENVIYVHDKNISLRKMFMQRYAGYKMEMIQKMDWVNIFNGTLKAAAWFRR